MTILRSGSKAALRREWLEQNRIRSALERRVARRLRAEIVRAGRNASEGFLADGVRGAILSLEGHAARLTSILDPHWRRTFQIFGERLHDSVKADQSIIERKQDVESAFSFRVQEWIASIGAEKVRNVSNTTIEQIRQTILFGQQEGESNASIATSIRNKTKNISWQRGFVIARTETHSASQAAQKDMLEVLDLPEVKREWVAAEDLRTRDTHRAADGQIRKQNEPFDVGAVKLQFPGDPSGPPEEIIQCRCVAASVVEQVDVSQPGTEGPVVPSTLEVTGDGGSKELFKQAFAAIPDHHKQLLSNAEFISAKTITRPGGRQVAGISRFDRTTRKQTITIADIVKGRKAKDILGTATHEMGHAVDNVFDNNLSFRMASTIAQDAAKMSEADRYLAGHYLSNEREMFAELYRLRFSPSSKGAFTLGRKKAERRFKNSLAALDELVAELEAASG